jgi:DNA-binding beta-propeller fold protein YncE
MPNSVMPKFVAEASPGVNLPAGRTLGPVTGLAVSPDDGHIWVLHFASILEWGPSGGSDAADGRLPPVVEFDANGNFLEAWGGPDHLPRIEGKQQWPKQEETISIDADGTLWIFGADKEYDHCVQRFTRSGELLLRIGEFGIPGNDESRDLLGCPTDAYHDVLRREVYITDGYVNHRVVVFNSDTGKFLRAWGAYGTRTPFTGSGRQTFNNPVHSISLGPEGHLYVCDRKNDRVQVFDALGRTEPHFVREVEVKADSPFGAAFNVTFTLGGDYMLVCDGSNNRIWVVDCKAWEIVGSFLGASSEHVGISGTIHKIVTDKSGNLLLGYPSRGLGGVRKMRCKDAHSI